MFKKLTKKTNLFGIIRDALCENAKQLLGIMLIISIVYCPCVIWQCFYVKHIKIGYLPIIYKILLTIAIIMLVLDILLIIPLAISGIIYGVNYFILWYNFRVGLPVSEADLDAIGVYTKEDLVLFLGAYRICGGKGINAVFGYNNSSKYWKNIERLYDDLPSYTVCERLNIYNVLTFKIECATSKLAKEVYTYLYSMRHYLSDIWGNEFLNKTLDHLEKIETVADPEKYFSKKKK